MKNDLKTFKQKQEEMLKISYAMKVSSECEYAFKRNKQNKQLNQILDKTLTECSERINEKGERRYTALGRILSE